MIKFFKGFGYFSLLLTSYSFLPIHSELVSPAFISIGSAKIYIYEVFVFIFAFYFFLNNLSKIQGNDNRPYFLLVGVIVLYFTGRFIQEGIFTQSSIRSFADSLTIILLVLVPVLWKKSSENLLRIFAWNGIIFSLIHLFGYLGIRSIAEQNIYGGFTRYSTSTGLIVIGISLFISYYYFYREKRKKFYLAIAILDIVTLALSFKRTVILALLIISLYSLYSQRKSVNALLSNIFLILLSLGILLFLFNDIFLNNLDRILMSDDEFNSGVNVINRMTFYKLSLVYIFKYPPVMLIGDGFSGGFYKEFLFLPTWSIHNTYLQIFLSYGIFLFIVFIYLILKIYKGIKQINNKNIKYAMLFSYLYVLIWFLFNPTLNQVNENFICYMLFGLIIKISQENNGIENSSSV